MLVLIQFPYADLRPFVDEADRRKPGPLWSTKPRGINPDFVRGFGALRSRPGANDGPAIRSWPGEAWFAEASGSIRFRPLTHRDFPGAGLPLVPQLALRRVYADGFASWRAEVGIAFDPRAEPDADQIVATVRDVLALPVRVKVAGAWTDFAPLGRQARTIGRALTAASTYRSTSAARRALPLRPGRPMVLVESRAIDGLATDAARASPHHVRLPGSRPGTTVDVDYATLTIDREESPYLLLRDPDVRRDSGRTSRDVRTHLCRLHAEREVLTQVLRAAEKGLVPDASAALESYLASAHAALFATTRRGLDVQALTPIFDVYDRITAAEGDALLRLLEGRRQTRERTIALLASNRPPDARIVYQVFTGPVDHRVTIEGDNFGIAAAGSAVTNTGTLAQGGAAAAPATRPVASPAPDAADALVAAGPHASNEGNPMTTNGNNQVSIGGNATGIVSVGTTFTNSGTIIQGLDDGHLKSALAALKETGERLVAHLPDDARKQAVANKVEAMTKEATSKEPDVDMLKVTGKGLIEAAKTVADMAAPIAKAVVGVLTICGVVL